MPILEPDHISQDSQSQQPDQGKVVKPRNKEMQLET